MPRSDSSGTLASIRSAMNSSINQYVFRLPHFKPFVSVIDIISLIDTSWSVISTKGIRFPRRRSESCTPWADDHPWWPSIIMHSANIARCKSIIFAHGKYNHLIRHGPLSWKDCMHSHWSDGGMAINRPMINAHTPREKELNPSYRDFMKVM